jgi:endonuclease-3 related protein
MRPNKLVNIYQLLLSHFGHQHWWPGDTHFEIMVGAILTQNTNWENVSKALDALKQEDLLSYEKLRALPAAYLAEKIKACGYFNLKAARLHNLFQFIENRYDGDIDALLAAPLEQLREDLLSVKGIGPETADSILLYAAEKPVFVVDAYTYRILSRHDVLSEDESDYDEIQTIITDSLPEDTALYNEYHALLVQTGKAYCKKTNPRCESCPLQGY